VLGFWRRGCIASHGPSPTLAWAFMAIGAVWGVGHIWNMKYIWNTYVIHHYTSLYTILQYYTIINIVHMDTYGHIVKVCKDVRTPHRSCEFGRRCDWGWNRTAAWGPTRHSATATAAANTARNHNPSSHFKSDGSMAYNYHSCKWVKKWHLCKLHVAISPHIRV